MSGDCDTTAVVFEGEQTIRTVTVAAERLRSAVAGGMPVVVDCDAVTEADLSFVQLLLAARQAAKTAGKPLALAAPARGALRECLLTGGFLHDDVEGRLSSETRFWLNRGKA